ncbi:hypothetical protein [Microvirga aerophila]|uniref:hypothetical protein n=1 Tax=Microvirga aerophila TaxID=670291 RepID=UPI0011BE5890|nr:hypothetical protein [Microvirga aerophila]
MSFIDLQGLEMARGGSSLNVSDAAITGRSGSFVQPRSETSQALGELKLLEKESYDRNAEYAGKIFSLDPRLFTPRAVSIPQANVD